VSKVGQSLIRGAEQALAFAQGKPSKGKLHKFNPLDAAAIRMRLGLSQADFAKTYGLSLDAIRNWEQGRREPDQAAKTLLKIIAYEPEAAARAVAR
jgi:putative transcriptional regulator